LTIYEFEQKIPKISESSYLHDAATVIGDVEIGESCFIGAGAVLRGDYGSIRIGKRSSIQENCVIHARSEETCTIGSDVQVGHGSVLHNCEIKDFAVIGLGSRVCDYAVVGVWAIVGEGAVVTSKMKVPDGKVYVGMPAREIRNVSNEDKKIWSFYKHKYVELCSRYKRGLKKIS
jgi:carbonic anhydrase/acetyltransferase-like protein (isoleucine patch superfamily)